MSVNIAVIPKGVMGMMMSSSTEKSSLIRCVENAVRKQQMTIFHSLRNILMGWWYDFEFVEQQWTRH